MSLKQTKVSQLFLSTPSGWRATFFAFVNSVEYVFLSTPSGWRATKTCTVTPVRVQFLSTPSGWRATVRQDKRCHATPAFLSTPSGWRATVDFFSTIFAKHDISIHALRVEGDYNTRVPPKRPEYFYPRPPGGGRHLVKPAWADNAKISIHALRVEGDDRRKGRRTGIFYFYPRPPGGGRLLQLTCKCVNKLYFYPRPPGGGRPDLGKL